MIVYTPPGTVAELPIIDLAPWFDGSGRDEVAAALHITARDIGFFYVRNHGLSLALTQAMLNVTRMFFDLPLEERMKLHIAQSSCRHGYEPIGYQALDPDSPPDLKESFFLGRELGPEHPYVQAGLPNHGPNQWPEMTVEGASEFRRVTEEYFTAALSLSETLMRIFARAAHLPDHHFDTVMHEPMPMLRLLHYPPQEVTPTTTNQLGCGAHTDWGAFTLLLQDETGGLEVCDANGQWLHADPLPGTLLINLGDMMPRWTNGTYHSNLHRVLNRKAGRDRYSVPFFYDPNFYAPIACLPSFMPASGEPLFSPCSVGEHIDAMYRKTFLKEAQAELAVVI